MEPGRLAAERMLLLISQVRAEHPEWTDAQIGFDLHLTSNYFSKLKTGDRTSIGQDQVHTTARAKKIHTDYFWRELPEEPHYRDFLVGSYMPYSGVRQRESLVRESTPQYLAFRETPLGRQLVAGEVLGPEEDAEVLAQLEALSWHQGRKPLEPVDYAHHAEIEIERRRGGAPEKVRTPPTRRPGRVALKKRRG